MILMRRLPCLLILCGGLAGSCSPGVRPHKLRTKVVLSLPFEVSHGEAKLVRGSAYAVGAPLRAKVASFGAALPWCGVISFQFHQDATQWQAVSFPSSRVDRAIVRCVAQRVQFDFLAARTEDRTVARDSRLMWIARDRR